MLQEVDNRSDRTKREASKEGETATNVTRSYGFGDDCAAFFDSISFVDESTAQTGVPVILPITEGSVKFTCAASDTTQVYDTI